MKLELSDKICPRCNERLYEHGWSHCCANYQNEYVRSDGVDCDKCLRTIILYNHINVSKREFWGKEGSVCQCEHEDADSKN